MNRDSRVPVNLKVGLGLNLVPASAVGYFDSAKIPLRLEETLEETLKWRQKNSSEFIIYEVNIVSSSLILPEFG